MMATLQEHEILHLIDCVRLGHDSDRALTRLIQHCKSVLAGAYLHWQKSLDKDLESASAVDAVLARAVHAACRSYDATKGARFPSYVYLLARAAVSKEIALFAYGSCGVTVSRPCPFQPAESVPSSGIYDDYTCQDQCGWLEKPNELRPCRGKYSPPRPKPDKILAELMVTEPVITSPGPHPAKAHKNIMDDSQSIPAVQSLDRPPSDREVYKRAGPSEKLMYEFLASVSQLHRVELSTIHSDRPLDEAVIKARLALLPDWMRLIGEDLLLGVDGGGVFNIGAVAAKHGITPEGVLEIVVAIIERLRRHDLK